MNAVIFDLDGTLVDSAPDIHAAANALLRAMGYQPVSFEILCSFVGNGIPKLVERLMRASHIELSEARQKSMTAKFVALYTAKPAVKTTLYPGVTQVLSGLKAQGYALGICTNKDRALALQVLDGMGISDFFSVVTGGDSLPVKKPDPAPLLDCARQLAARRVVYVGDSEIDAATAKAAATPFALFTEGYRKTPVATIPHDFAFSEFSALTGFVKTVFQAAPAA